MFASFSLPAAAVRWRLDVPAGPHADLLLAGLVGAGVTVECIEPGRAYRLNGDRNLLEALAAELAPIEGATLAHESAPVDVVSLHTSVAPPHSPRRTVTIHGQGVHAAGWAVRAVERRLTVQTAGIHRWAVTGRTADLVAWLSAVWVKTAEDVLQALGITPETVAAEDTPTLTVNVPAPVVSVNLPDRRITSDITRDAEGSITKFVQIETSIK